MVEGILSESEPADLLALGARGSNPLLVPVDLASSSAALSRMAVRVAPDAEYTVLHAFEVLSEGKLWLAAVSDQEIDRYRHQFRQSFPKAIRELIQAVKVDTAAFSRRSNWETPHP